MKIINEQSVCAEILLFFEEKFSDRLPMSMKAERKEIHSKLIAAQPLTKEKVLAIIPIYFKWFYHTCDECNTKCETVIQLGDERDSGDQLKNICKNCLTKAIKLL